jgi:hypothetical protein
MRRRVTGATTSTTGKDIIQEGSHELIHRLANPSTRPALRQVAMPETMKTSGPRG